MRDVGAGSHLDVSDVFISARLAIGLAPQLPQLLPPFYTASRRNKGNLVTAAMEFLAATHPLHADVAVATPPQGCCAGYPRHHSLHLYIPYINYILMPEVVLARYGKCGWLLVRSE